MLRKEANISIETKISASPPIGSIFNGPASPSFKTFPANSALRFTRPLTIAPSRVPEIFGGRSISSPISPAKLPSYRFGQTLSIDAASRNIGSLPARQIATNLSEVSPRPAPLATNKAETSAAIKRTEILWSRPTTPSPEKAKIQTPGATRKVLTEVKTAPKPLIEIKQNGEISFVQPAKKLAEIQPIIKPEPLKTSIAATPAIGVENKPQPALPIEVKKAPALAPEKVAIGIAKTITTHPEALPDILKAMPEMTPKRLLELQPDLSTTKLAKGETRTQTLEQLQTETKDRIKLAEQMITAGFSREQTVQAIKGSTQNKLEAKLLEKLITLGKPIDQEKYDAELTSVMLEQIVQIEFIKYEIVQDEDVNQARIRRIIEIARTLLSQAEPDENGVKTITGEMIAKLLPDDDIPDELISQLLKERQDDGSYQLNKTSLISLNQITENEIDDLAPKIIEADPAIKLVKEVQTEKIATPEQIENALDIQGGREQFQRAVIQNSSARWALRSTIYQGLQYSQTSVALAQAAA